MNLGKRLRSKLIDIFGRPILWLWAKSTRMRIVGEEAHREIREQGRPLIFLVWHGRIFIVPYFFRKRGIMPLISPSQDGEIAARVMSGWGYKILRGSGSHAVIKAWNEMKRELERGGELIIVPDGPRGPDRKLKPGCLKLSQETGAYLIPFSFSTSIKKHLKSWDKFLIFYPFSKVIAVYGRPFLVKPGLSQEEFEAERQRVEQAVLAADEKADQYFSLKSQKEEK